MRAAEHVDAIDEQRAELERRHLAVHVLAAEADRGIDAARPAVVTVSTPPAIVRLPPTTLALVPSERVILHLQEDDKSGDQKHFMIMRTLTIWG